METTGTATSLRLRAEVLPTRLHEVCLCTCAQQARDAAHDSNDTTSTTTNNSNTTTKNNQDTQNNPNNHTNRNTYRNNGHTHTTATNTKCCVQAVPAIFTLRCRKGGGNVRQLVDNFRVM